MKILVSTFMDFIDCEAIHTTNFLEVEPLTEAKKVVHERITNQQQKNITILKIKLGILKIEKALLWAIAPPGGHYLTLS